VSGEGATRSSNFLAAKSERETFINNFFRKIN
jgi:hypothetical protein